MWVFSICIDLLIAVCSLVLGGRVDSVWLSLLLATVLVIYVRTRLLPELKIWKTAFLVILVVLVTCCAERPGLLRSSSGCAVLTSVWWCLLGGTGSVWAMLR